MIKVKIVNDVLKKLNLSEDQKKECDDWCEKVSEIMSKEFVEFQIEFRNNIEKLFYVPLQPEPKFFTGMACREVVKDLSYYKTRPFEFVMDFSGVSYPSPRGAEISDKDKGLSSTTMYFDKGGFIMNK